MVATVTRTPVAAFSLPKPNTAAVHRTLDTETHDEVAQEVIENVPTVGVGSTTAKLKPYRLMVEPPVIAPFGRSLDTIRGLSYVNPRSKLPTSCVTITTAV
jgi:hypothetical protein